MWLDEHRFICSRESMWMVFCWESEWCIASIQTIEYFMSHLLGVKGVGWREGWRSIQVLEFSNEKLGKNLTVLNGLFGFVEVGRKLEIWPFSFQLLWLTSAAPILPSHLAAAQIHVQNGDSTVINKMTNKTLFIYNTTRYKCVVLAFDDPDAVMNLYKQLYCTLALPSGDKYCLS